MVREKRTSDEIMLVILTQLDLHRYLSKTALRVRAKLNPQVAEKYFQFLLSNKFIAKNEFDGRFFLTGPAGLKELEKLRQTRNTRIREGLSPLFEGKIK